jgi:hypothetical protein
MASGITASPAGTATFTVYKNRVAQTPTVVLTLPTQSSGYTSDAPIGDFSTPISVSAGDGLILVAKSSTNYIPPFVVLLDLAPDPLPDGAVMDPLSWTADQMQPSTDKGSASIETINGHRVAHFAAEDVEAVYAGVLPPDYQGGDLEVTWVWSITGSTGDAVMDVSWEAMAAGFDPTTDSFASAKTSTVTNPTATVLNYTTLTFTNAEADSIVAGKAFRLRLRRGDGTISGEIDVFAVKLREVA